MHKKKPRKTRKNRKKGRPNNLILNQLLLFKSINKPNLRSLRKLRPCPIKMSNKYTNAYCQELQEKKIAANQSTVPSSKSINRNTKKPSSEIENLATKLGKRKIKKLNSS